MAFPYVCVPCLNEKHDECEEHKDTPPADSFVCGGGFCVCTHTGIRGKFEQDVYDKSRRK